MTDSVKGGIPRGVATKRSRQTASRPSLRVNVAWTLVGNLGYALCQWAMLVVIAKLSTPETVGKYALALSIAAPVMMLATLNLRAVQATDTREDYPFTGYLSLRLLTTIAALIVIGGILLVTDHDRSTVMVIAFVGLAKAMESLSDAYYGMMQQHEQMNIIARSMLIRGVVSLVAMAIAIVITGSIVVGTAALFASWLAVLILFDIRHGRAYLGSISVPSFTWRLDRSMLVSLAWLALPLGIVQLLISLNTNIPRYFIGASMGERELGIYAAIAYLISGVSTGVVAVCNAASPRLARQFQEHDFAAFRTLLLKLILLFSGIGALGAIGALVIGRFALTLVYTSEYAGSVDVLVILSIGFGVSAVVSVLGFGLTATRSFRSQVPLVGVALITTVVMCALLIPRYGLVGTSLASVLGLTIWLVGSALTLTRVVRSAALRMAEQSQ